MSNIQWAGQPSTRVHRGASRQAQKRTRWMYVPKKRQPVGWVDVRLYLECSVVTFAAVLALFFVGFYAGL